MAGFCFWSVVVICFVQFIFIGHLLIKQQQQKVKNDSILAMREFRMNNPPGLKEVVCPPISSLSTTVIPTHQTSIALSSSLHFNKAPVYGGVAAVLLLHAPAWFQRR